MTATAHRPLWEQMLRAEEANLAFFADRTERPGVTLFRAERADAPEFNVALVYHVAAETVDHTLAAIVDHFAVDRRAHVRLSPGAVKQGLTERLQRSGFVKTGERLVYFSVPATAKLRVNPEVRIERVSSLEDSDRFSAIQAAGFDLPTEHREWDRELTRRHLAEGQHVFYLASIGEGAIGAARSIRVSGGITAMAALTTLPDARGQGVGTSLLGRMVDDARETGSRVVGGVVQAGSYAAGLYDRLGFVSCFSAQTFAITPETPSENDSSR